MVRRGDDAVGLQFIEKGLLGQGGNGAAAARPHQHYDAAMPQTQQSSRRFDDGGSLARPGSGETDAGHGAEKGKGRDGAGGKTFQHLARARHDDPGVSRRPRDERGDAPRIHREIDERLLGIKGFMPGEQQVLTDVDDEIDPGVVFFAEEQGDAQRRDGVALPRDDDPPPSFPRIAQDPLLLQLPQGRLDSFGVHPQIPGEAFPAGKPRGPFPAEYLIAEMSGDLLGGRSDDKGHDALTCPF